MSNHIKKLNEIPFSVLDLSPIVAGSTPADSFRNTMELAQLAEKLGYNAIGSLNIIICRLSPALPLLY